MEKLVQWKGVPNLSHILVPAVHSYSFTSEELGVHWHSALVFAYHGMEYVYALMGWHSLVP